MARPGEHQGRARSGGHAIEALKEIIEDQHETIALLTGPAALQ
jgi:hypothetical protein